MWEMAKSSIVLFFQGKLFADPALVLRQIAIVAVITAILLVVIAKIGAAALAGGRRRRPDRRCPATVSLQGPPLSVRD